MSDSRTDFLGRREAAVGDRYAIEREIGRGGTAIVSLAQETKHTRRVVTALADSRDIFRLATFHRQLVRRALPDVTTCLINGCYRSRQ